MMIDGVQSPSREIAGLMVRADNMLREVGRIRERIAVLRAREINDRADPLAETPVYIHAGATLQCIEMGGIGCCEFGSDPLHS